VKSPFFGSGYGHGGAPPVCRNGTVKSAAKIGNRTEGAREGPRATRYTQHSMFATTALTIIAALALANLSAAATPCRTSADCSFNGDCRRGMCECDAAWRGHACATLNLLPVPVGAGLNASDTDGSISSWGGAVHQGEDGSFHRFVSQFVNHCGFNQWDYNSRIVHATSDRADGRYTVRDVVQPLWAHNPAVARGPNGEWVLTFVSNSSGAHYAATCEDGAVTINSSISVNPIERNYMAVAHSPHGPWSTPVSIDAPFDDAVPPFMLNGQRSTACIATTHTPSPLMFSADRMCRSLARLVGLT
jgi:hypothetical protein